MAETARSQVRLIDIARKLNLTKVSVSKALRDHPDISLATRQLVKKTAEEMGYLPNYFARSLQTKRSNVLGVIVPKVRHAFFAEVIAGIQTAASQRNYEILLGVSEEDPEVERRHIETFIGMGADALLVSMAAHADGDLDAAYRRVIGRGVPLVFFDRAPQADGDGFSRVVMDDRSAARAAIELAVDRGCSRIAHLAGFAHVNIGFERRKGYEEAMRARALTVRDDWIIEGDFGELTGYRNFKRLWAAGPIDAVFCASFPLALGAIDAMREIAPEALDKVVIIFFGLTDIIRFLGVPYICIAQPAFELGRCTVDAVFAALDGQPVPSATLSLEVVTNADGIRIPYLPALT